jgi:hypothetical protein
MSFSHTGYATQSDPDFPSHPIQNDRHQENKQQMLVRTRGKGTPIHCWCNRCGNRVQFPQKAKVDLPLTPPYPKECNQHTRETPAHPCLLQLCSPNPNCGISQGTPTTNEWIKKIQCTHTHHGILLSHKEK